VIQGKEQADYVRNLLGTLKFETTTATPEPSLLDPPLYAFVVTPTSESPMTAVELENLLARDERIELEFVH
jgi:hypothetical protein